ncbi:hypothetical protein A2954_03935 [Candidatus Roizmanbacteria bacterium RIFCSPLOWO2_01_FULL_37_12]|uniref:Bacterial spore germination immunoglobulin-like domain-containing protein n=1 Tax=Candidatus Roizmanbacteria bacterium RIFCSPLOWO2_01_FULL_37_12 TaxID=1802056 RepID=A0A1F7IES0_9BACT|nr:MAG: hypothetical protein A3D76_03220 [Candidatus Roizmanbacteria bacterium RIFCSPHIGHO2_02_FULL_37_9b]OGK41835.1 MAG: hypothetical protein A2954_03935 [Candidatus Roizmanbacteria bacterium RIFCSPLOWO2_01_FULL_37_12]
MKKETIIAVVFGIMFGALVAVFLLAKNKEIQQTKTKTIAPSEKISKARKNTVANRQQLEILAPQDGLVFNSKTVTIKGKAEKESLIIIQSPLNDMATETVNEEFSLSFPLAVGENIIKITAYSKDTKVRLQEKELHIYNLDEEI